MRGLSIRSSDSRLGGGRPQGPSPPIFSYRLLASPGCAKLDLSPTQRVQAAASRRFAMAAPGDTRSLWDTATKVRFRGSLQPVDATHSLNRSAGDWKSSVFRGRSLSSRATLLSWAWECDVKIGSLREVLPQQPVGVFVGSALPRALRIAEVDVDFGFHGEALMIGEFLAAIPGQRLVELVRQFARLLDQGVDHGLRLPVRDLGEHHIA